MITDSSGNGNDGYNGDSSSGIPNDCVHAGDDGYQFDGNCHLGVQGLSVS